MAKQELDIAAELARFGAMMIAELRAEWRRLHRMQPPMRLSRDLLIRGMTYKLQERALGGLSKSMSRKLEPSHADLANADRRSVVAPVTLKPGTRLVREWHGVTHTVLIHAHGIEWRGQRYASLSVIAREITGAHWSGPRFFGLRSRATATRDPEQVDAET
ncbi:MAG: DUF2924 domain-containing protein [Hyphomicrobium sp.]